MYDILDIMYIMCYYMRVLHDTYLKGAVFICLIKRKRPVSV